MAKVLSHGPVRTPVEGVASLTVAPEPLNFAADFRRIDQAPGRVVYTDVTSPVSQPSTLRIAQSARPNIYAGTSIETAAMLPLKRGCDTVVEIKEVWSLTDAGDPTFIQLIPVRAALTLNLPNCADITDEDVKYLVNKVIAALAEQDAATLDSGITDLLHEVVEKQ